MGMQTSVPQYLLLIGYFLMALSLTKSFHKLALRNCSTVVGSNSLINDPPSSTHGKVLKISKAMQVYLEKAQAHETMLAEHTAEFELGKRYLANMMDADPENFTQEDIDKAITYLLPSGLFSKKARPMMKPPAEVFPARKAAEFDETGRPHHFLFYTGFPNYYDLLHTIANKIESLASRPIPKELSDIENKHSFLNGSEWIDASALQSLILEEVKPPQYERWKRLLTKLANHPKSILEEKFILKYRTPLRLGSGLADLPEVLIETESERRYVEVMGRRKRSQALLKIWDKGSGQMNINGRGLDDFPELYQREQILAPIAFVEKVGLIDCEGTVEGDGDSSRAGAVRHALSLGLAAFEDENTQELMRQAGLLTKDCRVRERKKPGQRGARAKKTWKKR